MNSELEKKGRASPKKGKKETPPMKKRLIDWCVFDSIHDF